MRALCYIVTYFWFFDYLCADEYRYKRMLDVTVNTRLDLLSKIQEEHQNDGAWLRYFTFGITVTFGILTCLSFMCHCYLYRRLRTDSHTNRSFHSTSLFPVQSPSVYQVPDIFAPLLQRLNALEHLSHSISSRAPSALTSMMASLPPPVPSSAPSQSSILNF